MTALDIGVGEQLVGYFDDAEDGDEPSMCRYIDGEMAREEQGLYTSGASVNQGEIKMDLRRIWAVQTDSLGLKH